MFYCFVQELFSDRRIKVANVKLDKCAFLFIWNVVKEIEKLIGVFPLVKACFLAYSCDYFT